MVRLASFIVMLTAGAAAAAEPWWQFRGPEGQGHAPHARGLPTEWDPQKNVVWESAIEGKGWSSPVCWNDRIYLTSAVEAQDGGDEKLELRALCLDAKSGQTLWTTTVFERDASDIPPIHDKNSHASPTPLVDGEQLYVHFGHHGTACLDLDGHVIWRNTVSYPPVHGSGASPALFGPLLIFSCDGAEDPFVVALERMSGEVRWKSPRSVKTDKPFSFSTPLVVRVNGKEQLVIPGSAAVYAYDPLNGDEIWHVRYGDGYSVIPRPVYAHGLVFICSGYNRPSLLAIRPDGVGDVTDTHVAWSLDRGVPHTPSLLVVGDELYMVADNGVASCLDARTGRRHWQQRLDGNFSASPLYADGKIFFQSEEGVGYVVEPSTSFKLLGKNDLKQRTLASYAVIEDALLIRTAERLYCISQ